MNPSLARRIEKFSRFPASRYGSEHYISPAQEFAILLTLAGIKKVKMSDWFRCGTRAMENIILLNSLTMSPYVEINGDPLPWYLLKKAEIRYSGGAGHDEKGGWMQFSLGAEHKDFIREVFIYFQCIKGGKLKSGY